MHKHAGFPLGSSSVAWPLSAEFPSFVPRNWQIYKGTSEKVPWKCCIHLSSLEIPSQNVWNSIFGLLLCSFAPTEPRAIHTDSPQLKRNYLPLLRETTATTSRYWHSEKAGGVHWLGANPPGACPVQWEGGLVNFYENKNSSRICFWEVLLH